MAFKATLIQLLEQLIFVLQQWLPGGGPKGILGLLIKLLEALKG